MTLQLSMVIGEDPCPLLTTMLKAMESKKANIIFFAGGFSAADEPDGSAKFIVNILLNEKVRAAIDSFIE